MDIYIYVQYIAVMCVLLDVNIFNFSSVHEWFCVPKHPVEKIGFLQKYYEKRNISSIAVKVVDKYFSLTTGTLLFALDRCRQTANHDVAQRSLAEILDPF